MLVDTGKPAEALSVTPDLRGPRPRLASEQACPAASRAGSDKLVASCSLALTGVVLVRRQRDRRQDPDDRDHDHQFDKGKALLDALHVMLLRRLNVWDTDGRCAVT